MDLLLKGKRALITGGSRGIGKAVALALAQEGASVAILARNEAVLQSTAAELAKLSGQRVVGVRADTTVDHEVQQAFKVATELLQGTIDILVNTAAEPAGYAPAPKLEQIQATYFHSELDTKVMGYIRCAREVTPAMRANGWGRIINISGLAARSTGNTVGSIRNVALSALSKNMADELGPSGINVNVVHPGLTRTERTASMVAEKAKEQGITVEAVEAQLASRNSIRHMPTAAEVADVVVFLCSPRARAINGDTIAVGGGMPNSIHY